MLPMAVVCRLINTKPEHWESILTNIRGAVRERILQYREQVKSSEGNTSLTHPCRSEEWNTPHYEAYP